METEKHNWKKALKDQLKKTPMELLDGLYSMACIFAVAFMIVASQSKEQREAINVILNSRDWGLYPLVFVGLVVLGFALRSVITGLFKFIRFLIVLRKDIRRKYPKV